MWSGSRGTHMNHSILVVALITPVSAFAVSTGSAHVDDKPAAHPAPECGAMAGISEGFADAFIELGNAIFGVVTRVVPDAGFAYDVTTPAAWAQISWPLDFAFAPETGRTVYPRKCGKDVVYKSKASRLLLEPMIRIGAVNDKVAARFHLRPGYRFLFRTPRSRIAFGAGLGSTLDFAGGFQPSISPELVVSYGKCCEPSYLTLAARFEHYFSPSRNSASLQVGWTFH